MTRLETFYELFEIEPGAHITPEWWLEECPFVLECEKKAGKTKKVTKKSK